LRSGDIELAKNATSGLLTLGSSTNTKTSIRGGTIELLNDTTVSGSLTGTIGALSGKISYETTGVAYTIPTTTINQNYYLFCTGTTTYTITLPSVFTTNQIVHIRNGNSLAITLRTNELGTKIYPNGVATVFTSTWGTFGANTAQNLYSNGTNWIGF